MGDKVKTERIGKKQQALWEKAKSLPQKSGCYLMKRLRGGSEEILYVGKAKNLKNRVTSYFNGSAKSAKTEILVGHINEFDFIITDNEAEAFVLENNLIKKHAPKYNIRLKDDKSYPYIQIDYTEPFARPIYTRRPKKKKNQKLYGPFTTGSNISQVLRILTKSFGLRDCSLSEFKRRKRPCLLYQMKQCSASCVGYISDQEYNNDLNFVSSFLEGKTTKVLKELEKRMLNAAEKEEFEHAAIIRDNISTLTEFSEQSFSQNVEVGANKNIDIIAYHIGEFEIDISVYIMRSGILLGHKNYHFQKGDNEEECKEIFLNFVYQYYSQSAESLPEKVTLDLDSDSLKLINNAFENTSEMSLAAVKPVGMTKKLYSLTYDHAKEHQRFRHKNQDSVWVGLNKLKELLKLKETPKLLECYDIAIWQGQSPTAAQIVFDEGKPDKKYYRYYHLEERPEGNNDFAMMKEVLTRRLKKGRLPDVFIVDGGKGQVNSFLEVLRDFNLEDIPVVGIAKERSGKHQSFKDEEVGRSEERLVIPKRLNPYILKKCPSLMRIVVQMRDEAHRFSRKLHHKKEHKRVLGSWFENIEGIGKVTLEKIRLNLDVSLDELGKLSVDEISVKFDISDEIAKKIKEKLS